MHHHRDLVVERCCAQRRCDGGRVRFAVAVGGLEDADRAAPGEFGGVHSGVGVREQCCDLAGVWGHRATVQRDADAETEMQRPAVDDDGMCGRCLQFPGTPSRDMVILDVPEHHHELVAAEPGDDVGLPYAVLQATSDGDQDLVAHRVALGVVDLFEAIDVAEQQSHTTMRAGGADQGLAQAISHDHPIG